MGAFSPGHWIVVIALVVLLFGSRHIPHLLADVGRGLTAFRKAMAAPDTDTPDTEEPEFDKTESGDPR